MINTAITMNPEASPQQLVRTVQLAEELNISACYIADQGFTLDLYVMLTAAALQTKRIRLGPGVTHPYTRHPVVTAVSIASLDQLSGGRTFLGIGAGGSRSLVPMQIPRSKPLQLARETVEISRRLWSGEAVNYQGEFYSLSNAKIGFPCRPDIEVHWAARGPKMLELGGELADVNLLHGIPRFELKNVAATVRRGAEKAGRSTKLQYAATLVYDDASRVAARARTVYRLVDSSEEVKAKLGLTEEKIAEMRRLVTTTGPKSAGFLVNDELLSHFVIEGDPAACAAQLREMISALGLNGITVEVPDPADAEELLHFAADVFNKL
ncbi:MAG: LLM class flavin-dependent oxidoreductase [Anaerolineaceae bacterium]|nr:LLM class flavin-dependent oxidoreductase [Anaerolineaceae bacterium]